MIFNSRSREPKSPFRSPLVYRSFLSMTQCCTGSDSDSDSLESFFLCKFQPFTDDNPLIFASFQMAVKQLCISIFSQFNPWYMLSIRTSEIPLIYFNQDDIMLVKTFMICLLLTELMVLLQSLVSGWWCGVGVHIVESILLPPWGLSVTSRPLPTSLSQHLQWIYFQTNSKHNNVLGVYQPNCKS